LPCSNNKPVKPPIPQNPKLRHDPYNLGNQVKSTKTGWKIMTGVEICTGIDLAGLGILFCIGMVQVWEWLVDGEGK